MKLTKLGISSQNINNNDTSELEKAINNLVYKLYQITYDEVKIIDPKFGLTEQEYTAIKME